MKKENGVTKGISASDEKKEHGDTNGYSHHPTSPSIDERKTHGVINKNKQKKHKMEGTTTFNKMSTHGAGLKHFEVTPVKMP